MWKSKTKQNQISRKQKSTKQTPSCIFNGKLEICCFIIVVKRSQDTCVCLTPYYQKCRRKHQCKHNWPTYGLHVLLYNVNFIQSSSKLNQSRFFIFVFLFSPRLANCRSNSRLDTTLGEMKYMSLYEPGWLWRVQWKYVV